ncbi:unnamed protein product, partial [Prorocentrum cordatum]
MGAASCKCGKDRHRRRPAAAPEPLQDARTTPPAAGPRRSCTSPPAWSRTDSLPGGNSPEWGPGFVEKDLQSARSSSARVVLEGGITYEGSWLPDADDRGGWTTAQIAWAGRVKHGQGTLAHPDGQRYCGQFKYDQKSGYGTQTYPSGSTYSGQWADDLQNGHGTENWADGSAFEGQFRAGEKHGWGRFMWGNGCLYEGEFVRNDMHGEGSYAWSDGRIDGMFCGQWSRNYMGPSGSMQWPDGRVYEGDFLEGRKHGEGTHWWPDGRSYVGQWREGKQHGIGVARAMKGEPSPVGERQVHRVARPARSLRRGAGVGAQAPPPKSCGPEAGQHQCRLPAPLRTARRPQRGAGRPAGWHPPHPPHDGAALHGAAQALPLLRQAAAPAPRRHNGEQVQAHGPRDLRPRNRRQIVAQLAQLPDGGREPPARRGHDAAAAGGRGRPPAGPPVLRGPGCGGHQVRVRGARQSQPHGRRPEDPGQAAAPARPLQPPGHPARRRPPCMASEGVLPRWALGDGERCTPRCEVGYFPGGLNASLSEDVE